MRGKNKGITVIPSQKVNLKIFDIYLGKKWLTLIWDLDPD
jgi:hypothetical protein